MQTVSERPFLGWFAGWPPPGSGTAAAVGGPCCKIVCGTTDVCCTIGDLTRWIMPGWMALKGDWTPAGWATADWTGRSWKAPVTDGTEPGWSSTCCCCWGCVVTGRCNTTVPGCIKTTQDWLVLYQSKYSIHYFQVLHNSSLISHNKCAYCEHIYNIYWKHHIKDIRW